MASAEWVGPAVVVWDNVYVVCTIPTAGPPGTERPMSPVGALTKCALGEEGPVGTPAATRIVNSVPLFIPVTAAIGGITAGAIALSTEPSDPSMGFIPLAMPVATGGEAKVTDRPEFGSWPPRGKAVVMDKVFTAFAVWGTGVTIAAV